MHVVERRRYSRRIANTSAVILFNHQTVIGCVVCNISTAGAALEVGPDIYVPDVFDLIIGRDLPLSFHPAAIRASAVDTPFGAV